QWIRPWRSGALWQLGLEWAAMAAELRQSQSAPVLDGSPAARAIRPVGRHYDFEVLGTTAAAMAAFDWSWNQRLAWGGQLRLERTQYNYDNRMLSGNTDEFGTPCGFGGCLYNRPSDRRDAFDNVSARLEWRYEARAGRRAWLSVARAFRPPEINELYRLQRGQDVAELRSEHLVGMELGWHRSSPRTSWQSAVFMQEKRNVLLRDSNGFNVTAGRTRHAGIEYEWQWRPSAAWVLAGGGTVARHRYAFSRAIEGGETIVAGRDIDTAPRHLHRLSVQGSLGRNVDGELTVQSVGRYFADAANARAYSGHTLVHARVAYRGLDDWQLQLQVHNLFDARYADRADFAQGDYRYIPGRGRTWQLDMAWRRAVRR
ncbi:MAG: TonB-dependent receptor, partial [Steroidobacteraceae bacterium]|nr:TonB-dependent receptor [Steroidobacteraceae bacterium]MDW8260286.1 TonB-dependent receptor [Gammaproteobacteria bacterium]